MTSSWHLLQLRQTVVSTLHYLTPASRFKVEMRWWGLPADSPFVVERAAHCTTTIRFGSVISCLDQYAILMANDLLDTASNTTCTTTASVLRASYRACTPTIIFSRLFCLKSMLCFRHSQTCLGSATAHGLNPCSVLIRSSLLVAFTSHISSDCVSKAIKLALLVTTTLCVG